MKRTAPQQPVTERLLALAEPIRLRVLRLLEREELSVGEVARVVQLPQSTISRHLKTLADGGWIVKRAEGTATLYRLILDELPESSRSLWLTVREQLAVDAANPAELAEDLRRLAGVIAERREDSQAFFGRVAGQWDDLRAELFGRHFTALSLLHLLPPAWTVADLGCGTGNIAELLCPVVARVIAIDQSDAMLAAARKRLGSVPNVEWKQGSLLDLPIASGSVDAAACVLVLHHIDEPALALREMARILRPGGLALVVDMLEHDRSTYRHTMGHKHLGFGERSFVSMMQQAGLLGVRYRPLPPDPDGRGPGLFTCVASKPPETKR